MRPTAENLIFLPAGLNFLERVGHVRADQDQMLLMRDTRERVDLGHVVGNAILLDQLRHDGALAIEHHHAGAVRLGAYELIERGQAAAAGTVFHHDGGAGLFLEVRSEHARIGVIAAAGRETDINPDGLALQRHAGILRAGWCERGKHPAAKREARAAHGGWRKQNA